MAADMSRNNNSAIQKVEEYRLYELLSPIIGQITEIRFDQGLPSHIVHELARVNEILVNLVTDDVLGLLGATPEQRARRVEMLGLKDGQ